MRNGNLVLVTINTTIRWFLPYLWGMETRIWAMRLRLQYSVLTVPMRNGNLKKSVYFSYRLDSFLPYLWGMETEVRNTECGCDCWFLPYLWGMETSQVKYFASAPFCSYRTYEEWKLECRLWLPQPFYRFLPYLWGMETMNEKPWRSASSTSSYRTYEEWKLITTG